MKLDHLVILLSDLDRCMPFYDTLLPLLGLVKEREHVFSTQEGIYFDFRAAQEPERGYFRFAPGLNHLAFTAGSEDEIKAVGSAMEAAGFTVPDIQHFDDGSALFLRDVDGMRVELGCYCQP